MEWQDLLDDGYQRVLDAIEEVLAGLKKEDVLWQPREDSNSIGWLLWHLTRVQDKHMAELMEGEQLWISEDWYARFNRPADPRDTGTGHTPRQVKEFELPDVGALIEYHKAVLERSKGFFRTLSPASLDRELDEPWFQPLPTVGVRLISVMGDGLQHAGEAAYVRGLLQGKCWKGY